MYLGKTVKSNADDILKRANKFLNKEVVKPFAKKTSNYKWDNLEDISDISIESSEDSFKVNESVQRFVKKSPKDEEKTKNNNLLEKSKKNVLDENKNSLQESKIKNGFRNVKNKIGLNIQTSNDIEINKAKEIEKIKKEDNVRKNSKNNDNRDLENNKNINQNEIKQINKGISKDGFNGRSVLESKSVYKPEEITKMFKTLYTSNDETGKDEGLVKEESGDNEDDSDGIEGDYYKDLDDDLEKDDDSGSDEITLSDNKDNEYIKENKSIGNDNVIDDIFSNVNVLDDLEDLLIENDNENQLLPIQSKEVILEIAKNNIQSTKNEKSDENDYYEDDFEEYNNYDETENKNDDNKDELITNIQQRHFNEDSKDKEKVSPKEKGDNIYNDSSLKYSENDLTNLHHEHQAEVMLKEGDVEIEDKATSNVAHQQTLSNSPQKSQQQLQQLHQQKENEYFQQQQLPKAPTLFEPGMNIKNKNGQFIKTSNTTQNTTHILNTNNTTTTTNTTSNSNPSSYNKNTVNSVTSRISNNSSINNTSKMNNLENKNSIQYTDVKSSYSKKIVTDSYTQTDSFQPPLLHTHWTSENANNIHLQSNTDHFISQPQVQPQHMQQTQQQHMQQMNQQHMQQMNTQYNQQINQPQFQQQHLTHTFQPFYNSNPNFSGQQSQPHFQQNHSYQPQQYNLNPPNSYQQPQQYISQQYPEQLQQHKLSQLQQNSLPQLQQHNLHSNPLFFDPDLLAPTNQLYTSWLTNDVFKKQLKLLVDYLANQKRLHSHTINSGESLYDYKYTTYDDVKKEIENEKKKRYI